MRTGMRTRTVLCMFVSKKSGWLEPRNFRADARLIWPLYAHTRIGTTALISTTTQ